MCAGLKFDLVRAMKLKFTTIILLLMVAAALTATVAIAVNAVAQGQSVTAVPSPTVKEGPPVHLPAVTATTAPTVTAQSRVVVTPGATVVPTATVAPTVTPTPTPIPTATVIAGPATTSAQILNYGTDRDTFNRGEKATGFITLKNTGNLVINDVITTVSVKKSTPVIGAMTLGSKDYTISGLNIQPGDSKRFEFSVDIPSEYKGVSTAGDYDLQVIVKAGGKEVGSFTKAVKIT